jgi:membrane protein
MFTGSIGRFLEKNLKLLTIGAVATIVLAGSFYSQAPKMTWLPVMWFAAGTVLLFVFQAFPGFSKAIISIVVMTTLSSLAITSGLAFDPYSGANIAWAFSLWAGWAVSLTWSFMKISSVSRWTALTISGIATYIAGAMFASVLMSLQAAVYATIPVSVALFWVTYRLLPKARILGGKTPINLFKPEVTEQLSLDAANHDWSFTTVKEPTLLDRVLRRYPKRGGYLMWDEKAYYVYPVYLRQQLQRLTRTTRFKKLPTSQNYWEYQGRDITPWLLDIAANHAPIFKVGGADIGVILLDVRNINRREPEVMEVPLPDSQRVIQVAIVPAGNLFSTKENGSVIGSFKDVFGDAQRELTDRELLALAKRL